MFSWKNYCCPALLFLILGAVGCTPPEPLERAASKVGGALGPDDPFDIIDDTALIIRRDECAMEGGHMVARLVVGPCVDGVMSLSLDDEESQQDCQSGTGITLDQQCAHTDDAGRIYFNDGPSSPALGQVLSTLLGERLSNWRWNRTFWAAGVNHDYCYHHNPITRDATRAECDLQLYDDLAAVCAKQEHDTSGCRVNAAVTYIAVRSEGNQFWGMMNTRVEYPAWQPLWKAYGFDGPVHDQDLDAQVARYSRILGNRFTN